MNEVEQTKQRMSFLKEKLDICNLVKSKLSKQDPYYNIKVRVMNDRIKLYEKELSKIKLPNDLRRWS